ncbi:hypothetical protein M438DRAFT_124786 [Aureobasidium pullulans EXF-150]|uniref:Secreted protein n=1 Tax=Aureobasidium pullulans EXF-150 TaxID=1043002 RepID=A0A074YKH7_AURPU|nr:uncharacterized protein M438DRAFT_124786 [Aureobasidium pullulans EXF-150]KEQ87416.1 hypothetical protein M438DRAFT_124786 [Aureobasidium pullulans EXF-150]
MGSLYFSRFSCFLLAFTSLLLSAQALRQGSRAFFLTLCTFTTFSDTRSFRKQGEGSIIHHRIGSGARRTIGELLHVCLTSYINH